MIEAIRRSELTNNPVYDYYVVVAGTGAVYDQKVRESLDILGSPERRVVFDMDHARITSAENPHKVQADAAQLPFSLKHLDSESCSSYVAFVATPNHLGAIAAFVEAGFRRFIVEKPLVNNREEIATLVNMLQDHPDVKIYPLDFYVQKTAPLQILAGIISPNDPRWDWVEAWNGDSVESELFGSIEDHVGQIEGIEVTIIEGGSLGLPDLERRTWLEKDEKRGGMLLDLGTHVLAPLFVAKIGEAQNITVRTANRYILGEDRKSFVPAKEGQPEIYAHALLSLRRDEKIIPVAITVGKTFHDGGIWNLTIRGSTGSISMGLRSGQHLTVQPNDLRDFQLALRKGSDPYALAFQEAQMYFSGELNTQDVLQPMFDAILVIDAIKEAAG